MTASYQIFFKRERILVYARPCICPCFHPSIQMAQTLIKFTKIFIWWFWRVSIFYYPFFILHFLCGPGQTREMESQWGEEVGRNRDDHRKAEKAAGEASCMLLYFVLRSIILSFWASFFFFYTEFICTFVTAFFSSYNTVYWKSLWVSVTISLELLFCLLSGSSGSSRISGKLI